VVSRRRRRSLPRRRVQRGVPRVRGRRPPLPWGLVFFFKQKTAYEIVSRDWSSDVCSSDLDLLFWLTFILSIFLLDCLIYWQHRLFHRVPLLWRIHRVHHSDPELDVSSAVRFHPVEIVLSLGIKALAVWLFGIPLEAILAFDILLNAAAMFNHTNARLPAKTESWVQRILVTPDLHRIHHSRVDREANSNFGFFLSIWDEFFNTKRVRALEGDEHLKVGMPDTKTYQPASFKDVLVMPFKRFGKHR